MQSSLKMHNVREYEAEAQPAVKDKKRIIIRKEIRIIIPKLQNEVKHVFLFHTFSCGVFCINED